MPWASSASEVSAFGDRETAVKSSIAEGADNFVVTREGRLTELSGPVNVFALFRNGCSGPEKRLPFVSMKQAGSI
jgi:hypothetical protein